MDQIVTDFFNLHKDIPHNRDILEIPKEFTTARTPEEIIAYFKWIQTQSKCKSLRLDIDTDVTELKEEIKNKTSLAVSHREHTGWLSITLYGYSSIMTNSYEYYKQQGIVTDNDLPGWTDICKFFPKTVEWVKKNSPIKDYVRVRIMILEPSGFAIPHRDYAKGQMLCGPVNVAIINPPGAEFVLEAGGLVPWKEGDIRTMDVGSFHSIRNTGSEPRAHLIITPNKNGWDFDAMQLACSSFTNYQKEKNDSV
jgi:hypothetical protein